MASNPATSPQPYQPTRPWLWLAIILVLAATLRFWQLDSLPQGFYRDEAYNGIDALGILSGETPLYFDANNGREPIFIYLAALSVMIFGPTAWAVRAVAAFIGTLTTWLVYGLARKWFGVLTGLFAAYLWAITVWPLHLSRIGLRVVLIAPVLAGAAWLATCAWGARSLNSTRMMWLAAGFIYSFSFYTYLAGRFTPVLIVAVVAISFLTADKQKVVKAAIWGSAGIALGLIPLFASAFYTPEILFGRPGQVSIFNPEINKGDFWGTLWQHCVRTLGLFLWRGDEIIRHNPPGRPLFDLFMAVPFVIGLVMLVRQIRKPEMWITALWVAIMVWPTILAEDAPHFLRTAGILPVVLLIPALGLSTIASWPKLARLWRTGLIGILLAGSLSFTLRDYFFVYNQSPDTGYLFEAAAQNLANDINSFDNEDSLIVDRRYRDGWPSVPFLLNPERRVIWVDPIHDDWTQLETENPVALFLWPFEPQGIEQVPLLIEAPAMIDVRVGPLARGDLEPNPYPLYVRYEISRSSDLFEQQPLSLFSDDTENTVVQLELVSADVQELSNQKLAVNLFWSTTLNSTIEQPLTVFVQVLDPESGQLLGQSDAQPAAGYWSHQWFQPDVILSEHHELELTEMLDPDRHIVFVGVYPTGQPERRFTMTGAEGNPYSSNTVQLNLEKAEP